MKVPFMDFIKNMSQALSMCLSKSIKVDKWNYLKNSLSELKKHFVKGSYESLEKLEGKNWRGPNF